MQLPHSTHSRRREAVRLGDAETGPMVTSALANPQVGRTAGCRLGDGAIASSLKPCRMWERERGSRLYEAMTTR